MESKNYEPPHYATFSLFHHFPVFDRNILFRNCHEEPLVYVLPFKLQTNYYIHTKQKGNLNIPVSFSEDKNHFNQINEDVKLLMFR